MYESQRDAVTNQAFNVDQAAFVQGSLQDTQNTVAAMKAASGQIKGKSMKHKRRND